MISRHWKGIARREFADGYVDHLRCETFPQLAALPGFIRASILRREVPDGIEFQVVTLWDSLSAIKAFAGHDIEASVVPDRVRVMMVRYDEQVVHYEVLHTFE